MAAIPLNPDVAAKIVADWRTGAFSQQALADKHGVSKGKINNLCKGVEQDTKLIVTAGIEYQTGLAGHDDRNVTAVMAVVDERVKHIQFFTDAAVRNVQESMQARCENQTDYKSRAETINKGRETVLGKSPEIQINNNPLNDISGVLTQIREAQARLGLNVIDVTATRAALGAGPNATKE